MTGTAISDNAMISLAAEALNDRLPSGWDVPNGSPGSRRQLPSPRHVHNPSARRHEGNSARRSHVAAHRTPGPDLACRLAGVVGQTGAAAALVVAPLVSELVTLSDKHLASVTGMIFTSVKSHFSRVARYEHA